MMVSETADSAISTSLPISDKTTHPTESTSDDITQSTPVKSELHSIDSNGKQQENEEDDVEGEDIDIEEDHDHEHDHNDDDSLSNPNITINKESPLSDVSDITANSPVFTLGRNDEEQEDVNIKEEEEEEDDHDESRVQESQVLPSKSNKSSKEDDDSSELSELGEDDSEAETDQMDFLEDNTSSSDIIANNEIDENNNVNGGVNGERTKFSSDLEALSKYTKAFNDIGYDDEVDNEINGDNDNKLEDSVPKIQIDELISEKRSIGSEQNGQLRKKRRRDTTDIDVDEKDADDEGDEDDNDVEIQEEEEVEEEIKNESEDVVEKDEEESLKQSAKEDIEKEEIEHDEEEVENQAEDEEIETNGVDKDLEEAEVKEEEKVPEQEGEDEEEEEKEEEKEGEEEPNDNKDDDDKEEDDEEAEHEKDEEEEINDALLNEQRKLAIDELIAIEASFAELRDKLYQDKLNVLEREKQLCYDGSHPELSKIYYKVNGFYQDSLRLANSNLSYKLKCIDKETIATRTSIHQDYLKNLMDTKNNMISETTSLWYKINKERQQIDQSVPDFNYSAIPSISGVIANGTIDEPYANGTIVAGSNPSAPQITNSTSYDYNNNVNGSSETITLSKKAIKHHTLIELVEHRNSINGQLGILNGLVEFHGFPSAINSSISDNIESSGTEELLLRKATSEEINEDLKAMGIPI
ncbi:Sds3-like-domain-containing protein [Scheffersomyces coipomensis]|uniref:Sds3-like-domain-containing protein n=1 Tax=Scheffersomyces coipomensis TaxID=1788519 RepID=UPI00315D8208